MTHDLFKMAASNISNPGIMSGISSEMQSKANSLITKYSALKESLGDEILSKKLSDDCKQLLNMTQSLTQEDITTWLQKFAKVILDVTLFKENQLVDDDFPDAHAEVDMTDLIESLDEPQKCTVKWMGDDVKPVQVLTEELYECLEWRKGALCYMYCCTLSQDIPRMKQNHKYFVQCCRDGTGHLQSMLETRKAIDLSEHEVITNDTDTLWLLKKGLFTDTHVLALMYGGELCYWYQQQATEDDKHCSTLDAKSTGLKFLRSYIEAVNGPLKGTGWATEKAEELINILEKS